MLLSYINKSSSAQLCPFELDYTMTSTKFCPTCASHNKKNKLKLRQVNFRLAIYLCEDNTCTYPAGYKCVQMVQRTLSGLLSEKRQKKTDDTDLDNWLKDFFAEEDINASTPNREKSISTDDLSKIIDEISNTNNEYELDLEYEKDSFTWVDNALEDLLEKNTCGTDNNQGFNYSHTGGKIQSDVCKPDSFNTKERTDIDKHILESELVFNKSGTRINDQPIDDNTCKQLEKVIDKNNQRLNDSNNKTLKTNLSKCSVNKTVKTETPKSLQYRILNFELSGKKYNCVIPQQNLVLEKVPTTSSQASTSNKFKNFNFNSIMIKSPNTNVT